MSVIFFLHYSNSRVSSFGLVLSCLVHFFLVSWFWFLYSLGPSRWCVLLKFFSQYSEVLAWWFHGCRGSGFWFFFSGFWIGGFYMVWFLVRSFLLGCLGQTSMFYEYQLGVNCYELLLV